MPRNEKHANKKSEQTPGRDEVRAPSPAKNPTEGFETSLRRVLSVTLKFLQPRNCTRRYFRTLQLDFLPEFLGNEEFRPRTSGRGRNLHEITSRLGSSEAILLLNPVPRRSEPISRFTIRVVSTIFSV